MRDLTDPVFPRYKVLPKGFKVVTDWCDNTQPGDYNTSIAHHLLVTGYFALRN